MKPSLILSVCLFLLLSLSTCALTNITVDDTSSMINYKGSWDGSGSHTSSLDYGGSHTVSSDSSASTTFTFTGVAVCFLSPLWPYPVSVMITVDGGVKTILNLTDPTASTTASGGSESSQSDARWCMTGLSNSSHEAVLSMPPLGSLIVVDGFIYTVDNGSETVTSSTASSSASATTAGTNGGGGSGNYVLGITIGAIVSALILVAIIGFFLFRYLRRRSTSISGIDQPSIDNESMELNDLPLPTPFPFIPSTTCNPTRFTNTSPAPAPITEVFCMSPPKSYPARSLKVTNPNENTPLNCCDLPSPAAGSNTKSTPSPPFQRIQVSEGPSRPPSYSRN